MAIQKFNASTAKPHQYNNLLKRIGRTGAELDAYIAQAIGYCLYHQVAHGNKQPWGALLEAVPKFAQKIVRDARTAAGKADPKADPVELVDALESDVVDALAERRQTGKNAPKVGEDDKKNGAAESWSLTHTKDGKPERLHLTGEEYQAALALVESMRKEADELSAKREAQAKQAEGSQHEKRAAAK